MRLRGARVGELTPDQIGDLATNGVAESRILEFKRDLPSSGDEDKREFLADVSAFANTDGGVIVFGVETARDAHGSDTGVAREVVGIGAANVDKEHQRLLSLLRDGVQPALANHVTFQSIDVPGANGPVLALGIRSSLERPHMVVFRGTTRFFRRSQAGKYQPDVPELRRMFLESASWIEECLTFRDERLQFLRSVPMHAAHAVVVHILPMGRLDARLDIRNSTEAITRNFPPLNHDGWRHRFNADGFLTYTSDRTTGRTASHTQVFRFGGVEGYSSSFFHDVLPPGAHETIRLVWGHRLSTLLEGYVLESLSKLQQLFGIERPMCLLLSLLHTQGVQIEHKGALDGTPIDRNELLLPAVVLESDTDIRQECRALMDIVWQSAGWSEQPLA